MAKYEYNYAIFRDDEYIACSAASVSLTKKDIKALEDFIVEHAYSPFFVDVPSHIYDKCVTKAWDEVPRLCKSIGERATYDLRLALSETMPASFIDAIDPQIADKVLEKMQETHPEIFENAEEVDEDDAPDDDVEEHEELDIPAPCKENTLYLPIKQVFFDQIMDGTKKEEYRQITNTTYKKYLECDEDGSLYFYTPDFSEEDYSRYDHAFDLHIYNNGVCPFVCRENLWYLNLAVGYNKVRDTALVQVLDMGFRVSERPDGTEARFTLDEEGEVLWTPDGEYCMWEVVFFLGDVVEKNIVSKKK